MLLRSVLLLWCTCLVGCLGGINSDLQRPAAFSALGATDLSVGGSQRCFVTDVGHVYCWGEGLAVGVGDPGPHPSPVRVPISGVVDVEAGGARTCALTASGRVACWGLNTFGEADPARDTDPMPEGYSLAFCGNGEPDDSAPGNVRTRPRFVDGVTSITQLSVGYRHTCGLTEDHRLTCWGRNVEESLGAPTSGQSFQQVTSSTSAAVRVEAGSDRTCTYAADGSETCVGADPYHPNWGRTCHIEDDGALVCEGASGGCAMGEERGTWRVDDHVVVAHRRGDGNCIDCHVTDTQEAYCWPGLTSTHEEREVFDRFERVPVDGVVQLELEGNTACVRSNAGEIYCWVTFSHVPGTVAGVVQQVLLERP